MATLYATTMEYLINYRDLSKYLIREIRNSRSCQNITFDEGVDEFVISYQTRAGWYSNAGEIINIKINKLTPERSNVHFHSKLKSKIQQFDWNKNKKNIDWLIEVIGTHFAGAHTNEGVREARSGQVSTEQGQKRIVTCRSCGAKNIIITGQSNDCEYCGSSIE